MKPDHTTGGHRLDIKKHKKAMKKARNADIERREHKRALGLLLLIGLSFLVAAYFETAHLT